MMQIYYTHLKNMMQINSKILKIHNQIANCPKIEEAKDNSEENEEQQNQKLTSIILNNLLINQLLFQNFYN